MKRLLVALSFLTALPIRVEAGAADVGRATLLYPLAGALLGAFLGAAGVLLARVLPLPLAAALVVALGALSTGALHLDGLADTADGLGGGHDAAHALRIMKDHAVGAFGATALVVVLLVKAVALATVLGRAGAVAWIGAAGALSRWILVPLAALLPRARPDGLGASVAQHLGRRELWGSTVLALGIAAALAGWRGAAAAAAVVALGLVHGALCRRRIGGMTGDTLGAAAELAEALVLVLAVGLGR